MGEVSTLGEVSSLDEENTMDMVGTMNEVRTIGEVKTLEDVDIIPGNLSLMSRSHHMASLLRSSNESMVPRDSSLNHNLADSFKGVDWAIGVAYFVLGQYFSDSMTHHRPFAENGEIIELQG
ncbi:hypothetical protein Acr_25g0002260 [Actinidia rufa]|uniref:Uncharacterized protein n=1 Tax=Actinidia rufa TaxID=165716 RepID=A0A7J0GYA6_9ERIC|nr:hypothetical protein Acr_25g0002260 [Actinidia rufa]